MPNRLDFERSGQGNGSLWPTVAVLGGALLLAYLTYRYI